MNTTKKKVLPADVDAMISHHTFTRLPEGRTIVCEMTMKNGFTITGTAVVQRIEDDVQETGEKAALDQAKEKAYDYAIFMQREDEMRVEQGQQEQVAEG